MISLEVAFQVTIPIPPIPATPYLSLFSSSLTLPAHRRAVSAEDTSITGPSRCQHAMGVPSTLGAWALLKKRIPGVFARSRILSVFRRASAGRRIVINWSSLRSRPALCSFGKDTVLRSAVAIFRLPKTLFAERTATTGIKRRRTPEGIGRSPRSPFDYAQGSSR